MSILILTLKCKQSNYKIINSSPNKKCSVSEPSYADYNTIIKQREYVYVIFVNLPSRLCGVNTQSLSVIQKFYFFLYLTGRGWSHAHACAFVHVSVSEFKDNCSHGMKLKTKVHLLPKQFWVVERRLALTPTSSSQPMTQTKPKTCSHSFLV